MTTSNGPLVGAVVARGDPVHARIAQAASTAEARVLEKRIGAPRNRIATAW
jgi:hypothetical protein